MTKVLVSNVKGPKGDKGEKGDQGIPGTNGLPGPAGPNSVPTREFMAAEAADESSPFRAELKSTMVKVPQVDGARMQSTYLGQAMRKLRKGEAVKIVTRGDSTTYGHDTVSGDRVPAPTGTLPDGSTHTQTRSPAPWPAVLQTNLSTVYSGAITVENQGYSGDWVKRGYERWLDDAGADITVISYGINDASAGHVPVEYRGNIEQYVRWLEQMILRDLAWGSAVVIATSMRQLGSSPNVDPDTFRDSVQALANKYGIPVIDLEQFLENAARDCWADTYHLTTKGNAIVAGRFASVFIGEGPQSPFKVTSGSKLLARPTLSNFVSRSLETHNSDAYQTPADNEAGKGFAIRPIGGQTTGVAFFSFYVDAADVMVFPLAFLSAVAGDAGVTASFALDFGVEQGDNYADRLLDLGTGSATDQSNLGPAATLTLTAAAGGSNFHWDAKDSASQGLRISTPGWHSIRVTLSRANTASSAALHALEFIGWRQWHTMRALTPRVAALEAKPGLDARGIATYGIPSPFTEANPIASSLVPWAAVVAAMGLTPWGGQFYSAPIVRMVVRTYQVGFVVYDFLCTASGAGAAIAPLTVGAAPLNETSRSISFVREVEAVSTMPGGGTPKAEANGRELASIGLDASLNLILNWRTTNSADGSTAKNLNRAFAVSFHAL